MKTFITFLVSEILFVRGNWLVGAAFALERPVLRRKDGTNFVSDSLDYFVALRRLFRIAACFLASFVLQIWKDEGTGFYSRLSFAASA